MKCSKCNKQKPRHTFGYLIDLYNDKEMPSRHSTSKSYKVYLENHIRPRWGELAIEQIKPLEVRVWLEGKDLAPKSRSHIKAIMHKLFEVAMLYQILDAQRNPMELVRLKSSRRQKQPRVLTMDESDRIRDAFEDEVYRLMCFTAQCFGLRASEILGLKWGDFDWDKMQVMIQRGVVDGRVGEVKTEYSQKPLPINNEIAKQLLAWKRSTIWNGSDDWVFASPTAGGALPLSYQCCLDALRCAAIKANMGDVGWHTFRHTFRTMLAMVGTPMDVQKALMRHASISTTMNVYGDSVPEALREAHDRVVGLLTKREVVVQ